MLNNAGSKVLNDSTLLRVLLEDDDHSGPLHRPTPYWRGYAGRIVDALDQRGLDGFRRDQTILKGFATGGIAKPTLPVGALKRAIWDTFVRAPGFSRVVAEYERLLGALSIHLTNAEIGLARQLIRRIAERFPAMRLPDGIANGGADDAFDFEGCLVTARFVEYLARAADFYEAIGGQRVSSIIEIGPGLGLSTLAHLALNPELERVVNVDIVPTLYISTQFLLSTGSFDHVTYTSVRGAAEIPLVGGAPGRPRLWCLPPWVVSRLTGPISFGFNSFSFQEMEPEVVTHYVDTLLPLLSDGFLVQNSLDGHAVGAGGQLRQVRLEETIELFRSKFSNASMLNGIWADGYGYDPRTTILLKA